MKLKGIVQIQRLNASTFEVLETIEQENTITVRARQTPVESTSAFTLGPNIILGLDNSPSVTDFHWIQSYVTGTTPSGATSPQVLYSTELSLYYSQWVQRFTPPSSGTRTIYLIGLTNATAAISGGYPVNAYVSLNTPCIQASTELLDVTYRVQWIPDTASTIGASFHPYDVYLNAYYLSYGGTSTRPTNLYANALPVAYTPSDGKYRNIIFDYYGNNHSHKPIVTSLPGVTTTTPTLAADTNLSAAPISSPARGVMTNVCGTDAAIGMLFGAEMYGLSNNRMLSWKNVTSHTGSPVQPIHSHAAATFNTNATPFLDATPATGTGKLAGGGTWTNPDLPEHYMVKITNTGDVGVATYQFWKRNMLGYVGTSFVPLCTPYLPLSTAINLDLANPYTNTITSHGLYVRPVVQPYTAGLSRVRICKLSKRYVVTADDAGVTIFDTSNSGVTNLNASSSPTLPVTAVKQVSADPTTGTIWVACANTGLWKVTNLGATVTHINVAGNGVPSDTCYAVDVGVGSKVWAVFNGGLSASSDGGTSWTTYNPGSAPTFSIAGITDDNWHTVNYMKVDRDHADNRMIFVRDPDTSVLQTLGLVWWSLATPTAVGVTLTTNDNNNRAHSQGVQVSDTGGLWVIGSNYTASLRVRRLTYGSPTLTDIGSSYSYSNCPTFWFINGSSPSDPWVAFPTAYSGSAVVSVYDSAGTLVTTVTVSDPPGTTGYYNMFYTALSRAYLLYLGDGVVFTHGYKATSGSTFCTHVLGTVVDTANTYVGPVNHIIWSKYGWNGSNWELNHPGSKPTHAANEELLNGITLRFTNGVTGTPFVQDEYYTFGVANGVLKDNSIAYTSNSITNHYPTYASTEFSGSVRPYPSVGTVTWKMKSVGLTVNPDQSLTNTDPLRPYGWYAISNNRVFGDFVISGTLNNTTPSKIAIGITSTRGPCVLEHGAWVDSYYNPQGQSEYRFIYNSSTTSWEGWASSSSFATPASATWSIARAGSTITLTIGGVVRATATSSAHSFVVRVMAGTYSTGTATVSPITVVSSGTGHYTSVGLPGNNTGVYDPKFLFVEPTTTNLQLALDGVPVTVKLSNVSTPPAPGEVVLVAAHGDLLFNVADNGKVVTGSYYYSTK